MKREWIERFTAVSFGLFFTIFLLELLIRVGYTTLPVSLQVLLRDVQRTPFTTEHILPSPIWHADSSYQLVSEPDIDDQFHYPDPRIGFHVSTKNWLDPNSRVGFRVPDIAWEPPWPIDAVVVGDSFTFCYTEYDDCWVRQLETDHRLQLVNLGLVATGSTSKANVLNTFGLPYQPRFVIWQWYGNDFNDDYGMLSKYGELAEPADTTPPPPTTQPAPLSDWLHLNSAVYHLFATLINRASSGQDFEKYTRFVDPYRVSEGEIDLLFGQPYVLESFDLSLEKNEIGREQTFQVIQDVQNRLAQEESPPPLVLVLIPTKEEVYAQWTTAELGDSIETAQRRKISKC